MSDAKDLTCFGEIPLAFRGANDYIMENRNSLSQPNLAEREWQAMVKSPPYTFIIRKSELEYVSVCIELNVSARGADLPEVQRNLMNAIRDYLECVQEESIVVEHIPLEELVEFLRDTSPWGPESLKDLQVLEFPAVHSVSSVHGSDDLRSSPPNRERNSVEFTGEFGVRVQYGDEPADDRKEQDDDTQNSGGIGVQHGPGCLRSLGCARLGGDRIGHGDGYGR